MPYQIRWLVEKRVLLSTFQGDLSKAELLAFIEEVIGKIRSGNMPVFHISDSRQMGKVELSLRAFQDLLKSFSLFTELGWQIDINKPGLNTMLAAVASQFVHVRTKTVASMEDAVAFLKSLSYELESANWQLEPEDTTLPLRPDDLP